MIKLIVSLLLAINTHSMCEIGKPVDYYAWMAVHQNYRVAWSFESRVFGDYWLMQADNDLMLFKFKEPIEDTIVSGASHGECFRQLASIGN